MISFGIFSIHSTDLPEPRYLKILINLAYLLIINFIISNTMWSRPLMRFVRSAWLHLYLYIVILNVILSYFNILCMWLHARNDVFWLRLPNASMTVNILFVTVPNFSNSISIFTLFHMGTTQVKQLKIPLNWTHDNGTYTITNHTVKWMYGGEHVLFASSTIS